MKQVRIELLKSRAEAFTAAAVMRGTGYAVPDPEPARRVVVYDKPSGTSDPAIDFRDQDNEVWIVTGRLA
jgi:hypothetical protein